MTKDDLKEFNKLLDLVGEVLPNSKTPSAEGKFMYFNALACYSLEDIRRAINLHLRSDRGRFFPTIYDIECKLRGTEAERSENAWQTFLTAMEKYGSYTSIMFPTPAMHYAIERLGGWLTVCNTFRDLTEKEIQFRRNGFTILYLQGEKVATFDDDPTKVRVPRHLAGFYEQDNGSKGRSLDHIKVADLKQGKEIPLAEVLENEREINRLCEFSKIDGVLSVITQKTPH